MRLSWKSVNTFLYQCHQAFCFALLFFFLEVNYTLMIISFKNESNQNQPERQLTAVVRKKQVSSVSLWKDPPPLPPPPPPGLWSAVVCVRKRQQGCACWCVLKSRAKSVCSNLPSALLKVLSQRKANLISLPGICWGEQISSGYTCTFFLSFFPLTSLPQFCTQFVCVFSLLFLFHLILPHLIRPPSTPVCDLVPTFLLVATCAEL